MRSDNLKRHIESCKGMSKEGMHSPEMDDDDASVLSFGTTDKAINSTKRKDLVEDVEDVIKPYKRSKEDFIPEDIKPLDNIYLKVWGSDHLLIS